MLWKSPARIQCFQQTIKFCDVTQVARYLTRFSNKITFRAKDLTRPPQWRQVFSWKFGLAPYPIRSTEQNKDKVFISSANLRSQILQCVSLKRNIKISFQRWNNNTIASKFFTNFSEWSICVHCVWDNLISKWITERSVTNLCAVFHHFLGKDYKQSFHFWQIRTLDLGWPTLPGGPHTGMNITF